MKQQSTQRFLWFRHKDSFFAAPLENLQEILNQPVLRPIPGADACLAGLTTIRDVVLPIFDPSSILKADASPQLSASYTVIMAVDGVPRFGVLADEIGKVMEFPPAAALRRPARLPFAFGGEIVTKHHEFVVLAPDDFARAMQLIPVSAAPASMLSADQSN